MSQNDDTNPEDTRTRRTGESMPWTDTREPYAGVQVLGHSERTIDQAHRADLQILEAKLLQQRRELDALALDHAELNARLRVLEVWALAADLFHKDPS